MKTLIKTNILCFILMLVMTMQQSLAHDGEVFIGTLSELESSDGYFFSDDRLLYFDNFTVVQRYADNDPDQRLPMSAVQEGDWIRVSFIYMRADDIYRANKIEILPDSDTAYKLIQEMAGN